jgi:diguanylate cyclase (GGDEF)-like protein
MKLTRLCNNLVTRLVIFAIFAIAASAVIRYYVVKNFLHEDQSVIAAEQQQMIASYLAQDINQRILERRHFLEQLALSFPPKLLDQPSELREWLRERQTLNPLFSMGLYVADMQGKIIADYPVMNGRAGLNISGYTDVQGVRNGATVIGEPLISPAYQQAILPMLAPVRDSAGRIVAVFGGSTALNAQNFLDHLKATRLGNAAGVLVVTPLKRQILASTDSEHPLQALPPLGADELMDKAVGGYRGTGIARNASGVEEIKAMSTIDSTGWFVVSRLPVASALPSEERFLAVIIRGTLIQAFVVFFVILMAVLWFFRPLQRAALLADKMTRGELPLTPLPVAHNDEVGNLTLAFNRLLSRLKSNQSELQRQAHHDILTGLPNRMMLADRMQDAISAAHRANTGVALLFLDLDGFKPINDTLGHKCGDLALQEISQRLLRVARHSDTVARVGGDEFVLLAPDLGMPLELGARALAEKCLAVVAEPLRLQQSDWLLSVSIGIAVCDAGCDAEQLLQAADQAMYEAKHQGRGRYVIAPPLTALTT